MRCEQTIRYEEETMELKKSRYAYRLYAVLLLCFSFFTLFPMDAVAITNTNIMSNEKIVAVYLLLDNSERLQQYVHDLAKVKKTNFNRVIFSFIRPTLTDYQSGNLADTGILGYYTDYDGKGAQAFNALKAAISLSKEKKIQTFISVGGWNYSCNFDVARENCGSPPARGTFYDWFLDPSDPDKTSQAKTAYGNLVKLANDLGAEGIDFDYEEVWHADQYAVHWGPSLKGEWSTAIAQNILKAGGPNYKNLMNLGTKLGVSYVMPKTVDKLDAILHAIMDNPEAKYLKFTAAVPPVGVIPVTGFIQKETYPDMNSNGGLWWKGNLKGLWYNLINKDESIISRFDSLALRTYNLCSDSPAICAPYPNGPLDLSGQVGAYMNEYVNWLKSNSASKPCLTIDSTGKVTFLPAKYRINAKMLFGFEVNQPHFPKNVKGQLQLTNQLVDQILDQRKEDDGVIIWHMYSKQNKAVPDATTIKYTMSHSCKVFLSHDNQYDCNADFPSALE